ncbi:hypothetical protein [Streptomyces sp. NPDC001657]|uniref:hypothetical protein n=1 Tax=Streptomyces sp. NPDC001657 TaxID=3154522 RepID=UPI00333199CE
MDLPVTARFLPLVDVRQGGLRAVLISECAQAQESGTVTAVTLMNVLVDFARTGLVLPESESFEATVLREELVTALDTAGCEHHVNDALTFGQQSSILTRPAGVYAVFSLPGRNNHVPHRDRHYLDVMHTYTDIADSTE